uniref:uncharacterized protein LOC122608331 n=1 Tax=Erigeron canadensis TaxID=72917 RepID=UPI001CB92683|nr:uncharacterized protein LOC122608331 [Erigeron canadensis]
MLVLLYICINSMESSFSLYSSSQENILMNWSSGGSYSGRDPDSNKSTTVGIRNGGPYIKVETTEAIKEYIDGEIQDIYSARSSFSSTSKGKEWENRKSKTEILLRKSDRRRPASLDMNNQGINGASLSPRLGVGIKGAASVRRSGMLTSPGTPTYRSSGVGIQKGWSSERVPLHTNANRFTLMANSNSGRTLPSKWEDAERWIISPVAGEGALKSLVQEPQRPVKSKSGPLGPPGSVYYSMYSPAVPGFDGGNVRSVVTELPFSARINGDNSSWIQYGEGHESNGRFASLVDHGMARSVSLHGSSESLCQSMFRINQDDKVGGSMDAATNISRDISRRDMATQMSPETSPLSSPRRTTSSSLSTTILSVDLQHVRYPKADMRDVQVDDQVTLSRVSKENRAQVPGRGSDIMDDWIKGSDVRPADLEFSEMKKSLSKVKREEAKITAWENLQKAKAEEAIRKLEMKLEKKRSSSMDRIMQKLRSSQKKAHEMRESVLSTKSQEGATSSQKAISVIKIRHIRSLTGCFTCPAF